MTEMRVHSAAPKKAHTESNAGKTMEMKRSTRTTETRMMALRMRVRRDWGGEWESMWRLQMTSTVVMRGLADRGILVRGMMATQAHMMKVRVSG